MDPVTLKGAALLGLPALAVLAHIITNLKLTRRGGLLFWRCAWMPGLSVGGCFYVSRKVDCHE